MVAGAERGTDHSAKADAAAAGEAGLAGNQPHHPVPVQRGRSGRMFLFQFPIGLLTLTVTREVVRDAVVRVIVAEIVALITALRAERAQRLDAIWSGAMSLGRGRAICDWRRA